MSLIERLKKIGIVTYSQEVKSLQGRLAQDLKVGNRIFAIFLVLIITFSIGCVSSFWPIRSVAFSLCLVLGLTFIAIAISRMETAVLIMIALFPFSYSLPTIHLPFFDLKLVYILNFLVAIVFFSRFLMEKRIKLTKTPLNIPFMVFILVSFFSIFVSTDFTWSVKEFIQLLHYILIYFIVINVIKDKSSIKKAVTIFVLMGFLSALVGLSQFSFGKPNIPRIDIFPSRVDVVYLQPYYKTIMVYRRVSSFFIGNALGFANFLLPSLLILMGIILGTKDSKRKWLCLGLAIMGAAFLLTYTRGAWIGFFVSLLALLVLVGHRKRFLVFSAFLLSISPFFIFQSLRTRLFIETMSDVGKLGYLYLWKIGLNIIRDNPIMGVGCGGTQLIIGKYASLTPGPSWLFENVGKGFHLHNSLLTIWAETGILGFLTIAWILIRYLKVNIVTIRRLKRRYWKFLLIGFFTAIIGLLVHSLTLTGFAEHFWILLAINMSIINFVQRDGESLP